MTVTATVVRLVWDPADKGPRHSSDGKTVDYYCAVDSNPIEQL